MDKASAKGRQIWPKAFLLSNYELEFELWLSRPFANREGVHQQVQQPVVDFDVFFQMNDLAFVARARDGDSDDLADPRFGAVGHDDDLVGQKDRLFDVVRDDQDRLGLIVQLKQR